MPSDPNAVIIVGPRLKAFQLKRMVNDSSPPSAVLYNSEFFSFFVASDADLRVRLLLQLPSVHVQLVSFTVTTLRVAAPDHQW